MLKARSNTLIYERVRSTLETLIAELPPGDGATVPLRRALDEALQAARLLTGNRHKLRASRYSHIRRWRDTDRPRK